MNMAVNAWEWMENWYDKDQGGRVLRGGDVPWNLWYNYGFRVVRVSVLSHSGENKMMNDEETGVRIQGAGFSKGKSVFAPRGFNTDWI
jgi:hypothetical protein